MYRLTERRLAKAEPILQEYRAKLHTEGAINAHGFEMELRQCWGIGYQELKSIIEDLSKIDDYVFLAAYYMEHSSAPGVVMEFKRSLARLYGIDHFDASDRKAKREAFWQRMES